ncbi:MAG TPA: alpha/beta hydrolase [Streptosporangiaceae bacterium]|nr:alpha/beta hydrolase [Streptosporangiaceae bacterium]
MGLSADIDGAAAGYEAVSLPRRPADLPGAGGLDGAVLCRRSARPTRRAVIYLHCRDDPFVPASVATWFTERGFHFYAADLRRLGDAGRAGTNRGDTSRGPGGRSVQDCAAELSAYFACLDTAEQHVRDADGMETVVLSAHATGALVAALWCHARRGRRPADALIMAGPALRPRSWLARMTGRRTPPLLTVIRRRVRRGLDISCPVLVLCPARDWDAPGGRSGLPALPGLAGGQATIRLGPHVTWRKLDDTVPGGPWLGQILDEQGRWLGAYLSSQIRDQLL